MEEAKQYWPQPDSITQWNGDPAILKKLEARVKWIDFGSCWVHVAPQKNTDGTVNQEWLDARFKVASSTAVAGLVGKGFGNSADAIASLKGVSKIVSSESGKRMMEHGLATEGEGRDLFCTHEKVKVHEVGFAVSKLDPRIGCSADGLIYIPEGNHIRLTGEGVELKCPPRGIYPKLIAHKKLLEMLITNNMTNDAVFDTYYHEHISEQHYIQMQICMFVYNMTRWHYVVYYKHTGEVFGDPSRHNPKEQSELYIEVVHRNDNYIQRLLETLLPALDHYIPLSSPPPGLLASYVPLSTLLIPSESVTTAVKEDNADINPRDLQRFKNIFKD